MDGPLCLPDDPHQKTHFPNPRAVAESLVCQRPEHCWQGRGCLRRRHAHRPGCGQGSAQVGDLSQDAKRMQGRGALGRC